jgi:hypothetical protein
MRFEFLKKQSYRVREKDPKYRITRSGRIQFNRLAVDQFLLPVIGDANLIILGYDENTHEIAIAPITQEAAEKDRTLIVFKVLTTAGGKQRSIPAKPFFDRVGLVLPEDGIYGTPRKESEPDFGQYLVLSAEGAHKLPPGVPVPKTGKRGRR